MCYNEITGELKMKISIVHKLEKPQKNIFIYALCEPNSEIIRYIGLSTRGFKRIKDHWRSGYDKNPKKLTKCKSWIRGIRLKKEIFNVIYLEYFDNDGNHVDKAEIKYIKQYKDLGYDIINHTDGGRKDFHYRTDISIPKHIVNTSPEARKRSSDIANNMWKTPGFKEEIKEIRKTWETKEWKQGIAKTLSEKVGLKIQDDLGNIYNSGQECATALGVKKPCVYRAIRKGYKCKGRTLTYLGGGRNEILTPMWNEYNKKNQKTITTVPIQDSNGIIYETFKIAAKKLNVSESHINKILKTGEISSVLGLTLKRLSKVKTIIPCKAL